MTDERSASAVDEVRWPLGSMFWFGTFGASSGTAARRYHRRCWATLGVALAAGYFSPVAVSALGVSAEAVLGAILSVGFLCIAIFLWQYVSSLDELARRLQMEAMAATYVIGLGAFVVLSSVGLVGGWRIDPMTFVLLEPVRGVVLVVMSRRYR